MQGGNAGGAFRRAKFAVVGGMPDVNNLPAKVQVPNTKGKNLVDSAACKNQYQKDCLQRLTGSFNHPSNFLDLPKAGLRLDLLRHGQIGQAESRNVFEPPRRVAENAAQSEHDILDGLTAAPETDFSDELLETFVCQGRRGQRPKLGENDP